MRGRCVVVTAHVEPSVGAAYAPLPGDVLVCADGGYALAVEAGLRPRIVIGDFDSGVEPGAGVEVLRVPAVKDDTDTMLCLRYGLEQGFCEFLVVGGIGGRLDHTLANVQALAFLRQAGARGELCDGRHSVRLLLGGERLRVPRRAGWYLSLLAFSEVCSGVSVRGVQYPLDNAELTSAFALGVSNIITQPEAEVAVDQGQLLVLLARDAKG